MDTSKSLIQLAIIVAGCVSILRGDSITACAGSEVNLSCDSDKVIVVERAFYGRRDESTCIPEVDLPEYSTCSYDEAIAVANRACFRKNACRILVSKQHFKADPCPDVSKYLVVNYQCVAASKITDVCDTYFIKQDSGYVVSPNYPYSYSGDITCIAEIVQPSAQATKTTLLDLDVEARQTQGCYDLLALREKTLPIRINYCGNLQTINEDVKQTISHPELFFHSDPMNHMRGFLIKYEPYQENERAIMLRNSANMQSKNQQQRRQQQQLHQQRQQQYLVESQLLPKDNIQRLIPHGWERHRGEKAIIKTKKTISKVIIQEEKLKPALDKAITQCTLPHTPTNGETVFRAYTVGNEVEFLCHLGFSLVGQAVRVCKRDGQWTGVEPHCISEFTEPASMSLPVYLRKGLVVLVVFSIFFLGRKRLFSCAQPELPFMNNNTKYAQS